MKNEYDPEFYESDGMPFDKILFCMRKAAEWMNVTVNEDSYNAEWCYDQNSWNWLQTPWELTLKGFVIIA